MLINTDEISIPAEAVEYIESHLPEDTRAFVYIFEVVELFFEWLSKQNDSDKRDILRKALMSAYAISVKDKYSGSSV